VKHLSISASKSICKFKKEQFWLKPGCNRLLGKVWIRVLIDITTFSIHPKAGRQKKIDYHNRHNPSKHSGHQFFLVDIGTRFLLLHPLEDSRHQNNKKKKRSPAANDPTSRMHLTKQGGWTHNPSLLQTLNSITRKANKQVRDLPARTKLHPEELGFPYHREKSTLKRVRSAIQSNRRGRRNWLAAFLEKPADFGGGSSSSPAVRSGTSVRCCLSTETPGWACAGGDGTCNCYIQLFYGKWAESRYTRWKARQDS
jgi:hypothetical protein